MRRALISVVGCLAATLFAGDPPAVIAVREIPSPAEMPSMGPSMTSGPDGAVWMSWLDLGAPATNLRAGKPASGASHTATNTLRVSLFDAAAGAWTPARTVIADPSVAGSAEDPPLIVLDGGGTLYVVWMDDHGGARFSISHDQGETWTPPRPWSRVSDDVEKFSLARLSDGRVLAAWLDGRARKTGAKVQQLYARIIGGADDVDHLVDGSVCDCCQTSLAPFLDGGALLAYRGRTADEVRDIQVARFSRGVWRDPRVLNHDDWRINACPVNGPRLASDGSRVAAAWFTGAGHEPRVLASFSPDAGARWLMPVRIDRGHPIGHVETVLLRDGAFVVIWLESDGSLWLRRVSPEFSLTEPIELASRGEASTRCFPRAALVRDYAGEHTAALLLVAYTRAATPNGVRTLRVDIPEGDLVNADRNCDCAPTLEQLQGFAIRGTITALDAAHRSVQARHGEVPGVFEAGMHVFAADPAGFAALQPGREFLGRVEWRNGAWRLFDIRLLGTPLK